MSNDPDVSVILDNFLNSLKFQAILKSIVNKSLDPIHQRLHSIESKLDELSLYLKQEEIEKATPIPRLQREMNLALNLSKNLDSNHSFVYSPVTIILGIYPFFKLGNPKTQQKITDFLLKKGTDEDAKEYFIDLLSVFKATRFAAEMSKPYTPKSIELDEYCHRYGRHSLELSVIEDFLKIDISFLELQTESESSLSIINSFDYDPFYSWFMDWFHTKENKFYTSPEDSRDVEFMCWDGYEHNYSENKVFRMVEIKIKSFISLYVFLPKEQFKLKETMKNMEDTRQFSRLMNSSKKTYISIAIPKLKVSSELNLVSFMESMGICQKLSQLVTKNCFGRTEGNVSCAHKAQFEFTDRKYEEEDEDYYGYPNVGKPYEISLEAAMSRISEEHQLKEFVADHSFIFVLEKDSHCVILDLLKVLEFMANFQHPQAMDSRDKRSPTLDNEAYKFHGGMTPSEEEKDSIDYVIIGAEREISEEALDCMSFSKIKSISSNLLTFINKLGIFDYCWEKVLQSTAIWSIVCKCAAEYDSVKDAKSDIHHFCRLVTHVSSRMKYTSEIFFKECVDAEYYLKRVINEIDGSDNLSYKVFSYLLDFYSSCEEGARMIVVNGGIRKLKNKILLGNETTGEKKVQTYLSKEILVFLESSPSFENWAIERMKKAVTSKHSQDPKFSFHPKICYFICTLEILSGDKDIWKVMRNFHKETTEPHDYCLRMISNALDLLWKKPQNRFQTGVLLEIVELKTIGLQIVSGFGGRSDLLMESVFGNLKIRDLFYMKYVGENGEKSGVIAKVEKLDEHENFYRLTGKTFSICSQFITISITGEAKSIFTAKPLLITKESNTVQYELYSAVAKYKTDAGIYHVKPFIRMEDRFVEINNGMKKLCNDSRPLNDIYFLIYKQIVN
ncbi:unnamed protein product [Caenorhabditis nigoni]